MPKIKGNAYVVELGRLLQRRREYLGISREALADTLGTKYEVIRLYEEGQRIMKVDRLFEILVALDISVSDFLNAILGEFNSYTLKLAASINTLDGTRCQRLIKQIDALLEIEKTGG